MRKINVAQVVNQLSIGGTEKTIEVLAHHLDKSIFDVSIYALFSGGQRHERLKDSFKTYVLNNEPARLADLLKENHIDIMHIHRSGFEEPSAIKAAKKAGVPVIVETKIFGAADDSPTGKLIDLSIFISKMCAVRHLKKKKLTAEEFLKKNLVLYNPIEIDKHQVNQKEIEDFKRSLGISPSEFVIGRVSRADPFKFGDVCLYMLPHLLREIPNVKYVIIGCPPQKMKIIKKLKLEKHVITLPEINDERRLSVFYHTIDLFAYAAYHGESFGITIAEAMAHRKPAVVNSTPAIDNAQVELVDHGRTGFIANSARSYANAVAYLLKDQDMRQHMGEAGFRKISRISNAEHITEQLEKAYIELCAKKGADIPSGLSEKYKNIPFDITADELSAFTQEYKSRKGMDFNKIKPYKLSILLIALNEEGMIEQWLEHTASIAPYEIVIVDGGSTDKTKEKIRLFARQMTGIKLIEHKMGDSFAGQRNLALRECKGDWVLALDADEFLSPNAPLLLPKLMDDRSAIAFCFPRAALFPDKDHYFNQPDKDLQLRLFRNLPGIEYIHKVHERPAYRGKEIHPGIVNWKWCRIKREIKILHYGYIKPQPALLEKGKRWQNFKEASKERGLEIGGEDFFILDKKKLKIRPLKEIMK